MKKILLLTCSIFLSSYSFSQNECNVWCFGINAGLDFNSGSPVSFTGVQMNQLEGCASICDASGSLLFYTDGITVMNSNHTQMPNGFGLLGDYSSSQSALILKQPGSSTLYYIITSGASGTGSLNYSIVDITLQGGFGDVTIKNSPLLPTCDERITAARHANGTDIWILTTTDYTDSVQAFLFTSTGISLTPVVSYTGSIHAGATDFLGYLKASIQADHLAVAVHTGSFELYDFDNATGLISNPIVMASPNYNLAYGVEFSPDGTRLYGSEYGSGNNVYQFDLTAGSPAAIINSATLIANCTLGGLATCLQTGPDQKIYLACEFTNHVGVINDPNQLGTACNFVENGVQISGSCQAGLPNYFPALLVTGPPVALFSSPNHICPGTCTDFTNMSQNGNSYLWIFPGANPGQSTDLNPTSICYNSPGQYAVTLIATNQNGSDTLTLPNYITVYPQPSLQSITQYGDTLFALAGAVSYQWYFNGNIIPGATDYFYVATASGDFNLVATDENGCEVEAVINNVFAAIATSSIQSIQIYPNPVIDKITIHNSQVTRGTATEISIYNVLGEKMTLTVNRELSTVNSELLTVDCRPLLPGLYYLELKADEKRYRNKFLKQ